MKSAAKLLILAGLTLASACIDEWLVYSLPGGAYSPGLTFGVLVISYMIPRKSFLPAVLSSLASFCIAITLLDLMDKVEIMKPIAWYAFGGIGASLLALFLSFGKVASFRPRDFVMLAALGTALMYSDWIKKLFEHEKYGEISAIIFFWQFGMALALRYGPFRQKSQVKNI